MFKFLITRGQRKPSSWAMAIFFLDNYRHDKSVLYPFISNKGIQPKRFVIHSSQNANIPLTSCFTCLCVSALLPGKGWHGLESDRERQA